jgi:hypothetical protein
MSDQKQAITATPPESPKRKRRTGTPPPPTFDFDALAGGAWLSNDEVAAVLRVSITTPVDWRQQPDHPLKWQRVNGKPLYRVDDLRAFIAAQPGRD